VHPDLARRLDLRERMRAAGHDPSATIADPVERRIGYLMPGVSPVGGLWSQHGAAAGLDVRDPTADVRLLEFCLGVPEAQYTGGGWDRRLIRRALAGRVPDSVRLNRRRGLQAADLGRRLLADRDAVEAALAEIATALQAPGWVDVTELERLWAAVQQRPDDLPLQFARGLQVGLFAARAGA
jgi:asparagine synthase (glutamine-hydrolysing)